MADNKNLINERINSRIEKFQKILDDPNTNERRKEMAKRRIERLNTKKERFEKMGDREGNRPFMKRLAQRNKLAEAVAVAEAEAVAVAQAPAAQTESS